MFDVVVNLWAVLTATLAAYALGAVWYGPILGKDWMKLVGKSQKELQEGGRTAYLVTFAAFLVMAYVLAHFVELIGALTLWDGALTGFWAGIGFVATSMLINYTFADRPNKLFLIDSGYQVVALIIMGAILGGWAF